MIWVNGVAQVGVDATDRGLAYGDGLFATMRTGVDGVLFLDAHQRRLTEGAARLGFEWQMSHHLTQHLLHLAKQYPQHCLKLIVTRGVGGRGYLPPQSVIPTEILSLHAIPGHYRQWQQQGIRLCTSPVRLGHQPLLAGMKHLNRLEQVLIKSQPLMPKCEDWLVLDIVDNVIESSMANIFFSKGNHVVTPSLTHCGVAGVMREQVIATLLSHGMNVDCMPINASQLTTFDSVFITNSVLGIVDVLSIDSQHFTPFPISADLRQALSLTL